MPSLNAPANGPPIVREPPGYLDGPLSERARLRAEMDRTKAALAEIQRQYNRLEDVIMWTLFDSGIRRCFDPFTRLSIKVNTSGSGPSERPISITDEDCGLSTQVMLNGDQRKRLAEILGIKEVGPTAPAEPATAGRRDDGPAIEGEVEAEGSTDSLIATREAIRRAGGSDWDKVGDPEAFLDRKPGERPRPVVSPAIGGPKAEGFETLEVHPGGPTLEELAGDDDASTWKPLRGPSIVADRSSPRRPVP
jgi:hypothetical protein